MDRTDAPRHRRGGDDGFSLIEVTISVAIIAVVMLGLGAVFVATAAGTDVQGSRQTAARIATDGLDRAHALSGAAVVKGRDLTSARSQWTARTAGVTKLLSGLTYAYDASAANRAGRSAALPTTAIASVVDGVTYQQSFYVAGCQLATTGTCGTAAGAGTVPMYDVVVSVAWKDRSCTGGTCTYELTTLVAANTSEPLFNSNVTAVGPTVSAIANQVMDLTEVVTGPRVGVTGGNGAVTLTAAGLPAGITLDPNTGTFTSLGQALTTVTTAPTTVTVTATDRFGLYSTATFTWTVNPLPKLTSAAVPLVAGLLQTVNLATALALTGGTGPYTWGCTGLTLGATLDARTGLLTVPAAALGLLTPTCTVTDARGKVATATLSATLLAPLAVSAPTGTAVLTRVTTFTTTAKATGCGGTCTWSVDKLPPGLTLNATTGVVTGKATTAGSYKITFTVRDSAAANRTATSTVTWTVL